MDAKALIEQAAGEWEGDYRFWFEPNDRPDAESATRATVTSELRGRTLLLRYTWRFDADAHEGLAIIGCTDASELQIGWSDTFHYSGGVMESIGSSTEASALGHYTADGQTWGWRTEFDMPSPDALVIRAFNVIPDLGEALATEARYRRVA